ncbi:MAG: DUF4392 domain-containing protein [Thermoflexaceae bacterium]|nr:DUF4392 domain-containing protein [Thermoflexaceae bacterium]
MEKIEDIVLRHSKRGMNILREYMQDDYCKKAAKDILAWEKGNIFLTTGFYVAGNAETDGPVGTVTLAGALKKLGYHPVIVTDEYCRAFFEIKDLDVVYMRMEAGEEFCRHVLEKYHPVGMISIERCGKNIQDDYANMRGISIKDHTAQTDLFFELTEGKVPSIGVGDGGNEIGMGNVADIITEKLELVPCRVKTDRLVIATVSNWGAYGITAYLEEITGEDVFPEFDEVEEYIKRTVELGSVDGVTKEHIVGVDGFDMTVEKEIVEALREKIGKLR